MRIERMESDQLPAFIEYCQRYGPEHDESFLPGDKFQPNDNNPTYLLLDEQDDIIGVASLMLSPEYRAAKKGRFRIFHVVEPSVDSYQMLLDAIIPHTMGLNNIYLFIPESRTQVGKIFREMEFKIQRYAWILARSLEGTIKPDFSDNYDLSTLQKGKDEDTWCQIINENFADSPGHIELTTDALESTRNEQGYLEDGMMILRKKGKAIGTVKVEEEREHGEKVAFISQISVLPQYRGRGLGKNLLRAGMDFAKESGYQRAILTVNSKNWRAADLYLNEGFNKIDISVCYNKVVTIADDEIKMEKTALKSSY